MGVFMFVYCGPLGTFASAYDAWNYTYCFMMIYPAVSFALNFRTGEQGSMFNGVFNTPRWFAIFGKATQQNEVSHSSSQASVYTEDSGTESLLYNSSSSAVEQRRPDLFYEREEYRIPKKEKVTTKIELDHSMLSLYFISQLNLEGERTLPSNLLDVNRTEGSTNQFTFNGRYQ